MYGGRDWERAEGRVRDGGTNLQCDRVQFLFIFPAPTLIKLHQFAVPLALYDTVDVVVAGVVPHSLVIQLHGVRVVRLLKVSAQTTCYVVTLTL